MEREPSATRVDFITPNSRGNRTELTKAT
jgi:hypothetical protein